MTPADIAAMQADALAGTPVAWRWHWNGGDEPDVWGYSEHEKVSSEHITAEPLYARVPRMETTIIALTETNAVQAAEIERLRDALAPFADQAETFDSVGVEFVPDEFTPAIVDHTIGDLRRARTALEGTPK